MSLQAGKIYEKKAKNILEAENYYVINENFHCRFGEIDLIALFDHMLVFIEVKFRASSNFGHVLEMVTPAKRRKLIKAAQFFLLRYKAYANYQMRFDVIAFDKDQTYWIKDAFN